MPLTPAALVIAANAIDAAITHASLHSANPGNTGASPVGTRRPCDYTVDGSGNLTVSNIAFTGLPASQAVTHVGFWTASTGGTFLGYFALTGDTAANAAGAYTVTSTAIAGSST